RLTDFDLVSVLDSVERTKTGVMLGSYLFMAPEQMHDAKEADARADVYGLGMTAIFCFLGTELPAITQRRPDKVIAGLGCSEEVKAVLTRAIELDPKDRYADARAFGEALRAAAMIPVEAQPSARPLETKLGLGPTSRPQPARQPADVPATKD